MSLLCYGFYRDLGMLTYRHLEMDRLSGQELINRHDDTIYTVLHCQSSYFKHAALERTFFCKFTMTDQSEVYILPDNCLPGPMLVVHEVEDVNVA